MFLLKNIVNCSIRIALLIIIKLLSLILKINPIKMKKIKAISTVFLTLIFVKCASVPTKKAHPFTVTKAIYKNDTNRIKGINSLNVTVNYTSEKEIDFQKLFYKGRQQKVSFKKGIDEGKTLFVQFKKINKNISDLQLHGDSKKEFGNSPSKKETAFPFDLKENEAILSYKQDNVIKYFKIKNIEKAKKITPE